MQALWQRHGQTGIGVAEDGIFALAAELGGEALAGWLQELVEGTAELPLEQALRRVGLKLAWELASPAPGIGVRTVAEGEMLKIANVFDGGAAQAAGLSAGDVLVAIDGLKATAGSFDKLLARRLAGDSAKIHVFRRDELMRFEVELRAPLADTAKLAVDPDAGANAIALREAWLA
jgi:predicted metalloprotease with PDZ domain